MEQITDKEYCTDVLSLAAFLNLEGNCHQRLELRGSKAIWVFSVTDELLELVNSYQLEEGVVSPREFMTQLTACRRELFKFLDDMKSADGN